MGYGVKGWLPRGYLKMKTPLKPYSTANISTTGRPRVKLKVSKQLSQSTASDKIIKVAPPATLVVRIGTKVNISTMGRPRVKIKVSKQLSQQSSDGIIKVVPPATLLVRIGTNI